MKEGSKVEAVTACFDGGVSKQEDRKVKNMKWDRRTSSKHLKELRKLLRRKTGEQKSKLRKCKSGKRRKTGASALCTMDDANCFHMIRLELKTSVNDMNVNVVSTVTGCDVTTVQQHYKGSTSTPPRVARLCEIRVASIVALRKFPKIDACSHVSIIRLVQSTMLASRDLHSHSSPLYHLPGELVSLSSVPMPSIDLNLWNRSRPSAFVPMSLGFTSVLTDDIVRSFRNTKS